LLHPPKPSTRMKDAVRRHKKHTGA
jgi:hypothetical protein